MTADRNEIRTRLLWRLVGTPLTLVPVLGGVSAMLSPVFFGFDAAIPMFVGITGVVLGAGGLALRAILGRETISQRILDEIEEEAMAAHRAQMKLLERRLMNDGDPRTEALLADLLALMDSIKSDRGWRANVNSVIAADLLGGVDDLFTACLNTLERTLELAKTLEKVTTPAAREALVEQREKAVSEVSASVAELGRYLSELRVLGTEAAPEQQLTRIRKDIETSLVAARQTTRETAAWDDPEAALQNRRVAARKEAQ